MNLHHGAGQRALRWGRYRGMSDTDDKQEPSVEVEQEIPTQALVESGAIDRVELSRLRKDYAMAKFREGVSKAEVARLLGINIRSIYDWMEHNKEFPDRILRMKTLIAMGLIPKAMKTLEDSMGAMDGETRRKAANDVLDHAEGRRSREAGVTINADKVTFNNISTADMASLAKKLGIDLMAHPEETEEDTKDASEGDPPPKPLPPVVLPSVPPADPPAKPEITELSKADNPPTTMEDFREIDEV